MFSKGHSTVTVNDLKDREFELVSKYLGINRIPCLIQSPLRRDNNASFGLYTPDNRRIFWKDFGTNEKGDLYSLLSKLWHCPLREVIDRIVRENYNNVIVVGRKNSSGKYVRTQSELKCRIREWRDYDIKYWESYGITLKWLKYANVYPISHKIIVKDNKEYVFGADKYAYAFIEFKEGRTTMKIYQPFNKSGHKWSNKHDRSVLSLWTKIPESGEKIVICSSLKDALCLWANTGIPAIALQGEGYGMSNTAISLLTRRFDKIYILLDNDETGLKDGVKLSEETGFINVVLPHFREGKDISDLYKAVGKDKFNCIMRDLLDIRQPNAD